MPRPADGSADYTHEQIAGGRRVVKADAEALLATLAWRGIASFPLQSEADNDTPDVSSVDAAGRDVHP